MKVHGIVCSYLGDGEVDVGKTATWLNSYVNTLFFYDMSYGQAARKYMVDYAKTFPDALFAYHPATVPGFYTDAALFRQMAFQAALSAWKYADNDWVVFIDASESISTGVAFDQQQTDSEWPLLLDALLEEARAGSDAVRFPFHVFLQQGTVTAEYMSADAKLGNELAEQVILLEATLATETDPVRLADLQTQLDFVHMLQEANDSVLYWTNDPHYAINQAETPRSLDRMFKVGYAKTLAAADWERLDSFGLSQGQGATNATIVAYGYARYGEGPPPWTEETDLGWANRLLLQQVRTVDLPEVYATADPIGKAAGGEYYLTPTAGTVSTPDPGPLPAQWTIVYTVLGPTSGNVGAVAGQFDTFGQLSWLAYRILGPVVQYSIYPQGTAANASARQVAAPDVSNGPQTLAMSVDNQAGAIVVASHVYDGTAWSPYVAVDTGPASSPFDSTNPVRIGVGLLDPVPTLFNGRIYSVELRTGLDPAARYLDPAIGTVTTPDPGPLPVECVFVFTVQTAPDPSGFGAVVAQDAGPGTRSWIVKRYSAPDHPWTWSQFPDGSTENLAQASITMHPADGMLETWALSVDQDTDGAGTRRLQVFRHDGTAWVADTPNPATADGVFDSTAPVSIGGHYTGSAYDLWGGRIYSVELRTGLDPSNNNNRYLSPTIGTVSTPDTPDMAIVGRVRLSWEAESAVVDAADTTFYWMIYKGGGEYAVYMYPPWAVALTTTRSDGAANVDPAIVLPPPPGRHTLGIEMTPGSSAYVAIVDGVRTDMDTGVGAEIGLPHFGEPVVIGGYRLPDHIYWAQLERLDASGNPTEVVWRFDANEAPLDGTATTWTDPRGRQWTTSKVGAISGRTLWKFDANEAPTDATTTTWTDPRGRQWTVTNPAAITGRTVWRFDAADHPGTGTSYTDPRGRVWTLTSAAAITATPLAGVQSPAYCYLYSQYDTGDGDPDFNKYVALWRQNPRDGVWYVNYTLGPVPVDPITGDPSVDPDDWDRQYKSTTGPAGTGRP